MNVMVAVVPSHSSYQYASLSDGVWGCATTTANCYYSVMLHKWQVSHHHEARFGTKSILLLRMKMHKKYNYRAFDFMV